MTVSPDTRHAQLVALRAATGDPAAVTDDPTVLAGYEQDWTGRFRGRASFAVRPRTREEVRAVLAVCRHHRLPVVTQGGNTGLVGGAIPRDGAVVLSTRALDRIEPVDVAARSIVVGAGATLAAVQHACRSAGLDVGVDLAARDTATIGGMVATNAGGTRVLRYGDMRRQVLGLQAVLADGTVVDRVPGLAKDTAGYDLVGLLTGSEGTLAVITAVHLRLVNATRNGATIMLAVPTIAQALDVISTAHTAAPGLTSAELMTRAGLELTATHLGLASNSYGDSPYHLLLDWSVEDTAAGPLLTALAALPVLADARVATDTRDRERLWRLRESHSEAVNATGLPHKYDVAVPPARLDTFVAEVTRALAIHEPGCRLVVFGHVAEGNLHLNVLDGSDDAEDVILRMVIAHRGTVSSEHGMGYAKRHWLSPARGAAEAGIHRTIKTALDPTDLLNPGLLTTQTHHAHLTVTTQGDQP